MNEHLRYYELQSVERMRELQREAVQQRLLAGLPRKSGLWRRGIRLLGRTLVVIGTRLEHADQRERSVVYN